MKKRMKTRISQLALIAMLVFTLGVPVYAAVEETNEDIARGASEYKDFNLTLYNGVITYTDSGPNNSNSVYVKVTSASVSYVEVGVYDVSNHYKINGTVMSTPGETTISPAHQYPNQYICAGFYRTGISGSNYVAGRFYYNGL